MKNLSNLEFLNTTPSIKKVKRFSKWQSVFVSRTSNMKGRKNG